MKKFSFVKSTYETTMGVVDCSLIFEGKIKNCFVYYKQFISLSVIAPNQPFYNNTVPHLLQTLSFTLSLRNFLNFLCKPSKFTKSRINLVLYQIIILSIMIQNVVDKAAHLNHIIIS